MFITYISLMAHILKIQIAHTTYTRCLYDPEICCCNNPYWLQMTINFELGAPMVRKN